MEENWTERRRGEIGKDKRERVGGSNCEIVLGPVGAEFV